MVFLHLDLILYFLKIGLKGTESEVSCQSEKTTRCSGLKIVSEQNKLHFQLSL